MGFGDKFKNLAKQAQESVAEHKDQIQQAVEVASVAANEKTKGKYATKIAKFGEKANEKLEKVAAPEGETAATEPVGTVAAPAQATPFASAPAAPAAPAAFDDEPAESAPAAEPRPAAADGFPSFD